MHPEIALEELKSLARSPHARVRYRVIRELAESQDSRHIELLKRIQESETHPGVAGAVRAVLREEATPPRELYSRFQVLLKNESSKRTQIQTFLKRLVDKGRSEWSAVMRELASARPDTPAYLLTGIRLTRLGRQRGTSFLRKYMDSEGQVGREAREALIEIGGFRDLLALMDYAALYPQSEPQLQPLISMEERLALRSILDYEGELEEEQEEACYREAREVMELAFDTSRLPEERIKKLETMLEDHRLDDRVLASVIEGLGRLLEPEELPRLNPWMKHAHNRVAANAIAAFGRLKPAPAETAMQMLKNLERLAFSTDTYAPMSAIWCIDALRKTDYLPVLTRLMQSPNPKISSQARQVMADWAETDSQARALLDDEQESEEASDLQELEDTPEPSPLEEEEAIREETDEEEPAPEELFKRPDPSEVEMITDQLLKKGRTLLGSKSIEEAGPEACLSALNGELNPRFAAAVIDFLCIGTPIWILSFLLPPPFPILLFLSGFLLYLTLCQSIETLGSSLGQRLFGLRTINLQGERMSFSRALMRNTTILVLLILSLHPMARIVELLFLGWFWRERSISPWDVVSQSRVIQLEPTALPQRTDVALMGLFWILFMLTFVV